MHCLVAVHARHFYVGDSFTNTTFQLSDSIGGSDNITQITIPGEYLESRAAGDKGKVLFILGCIPIDTIII